MDHYMRSRLKSTHREFHDDVSIASLSVPAQPSLLNHFRTLHAQFGDTQVGFLLQSFHTHTKATIQSILKCLNLMGCKLCGKLVNEKNVLAEHSAFWLTEVVEAGREVSSRDPTLCQGEDQELSEVNDDDEPCARQLLQKRSLLPEMHQMRKVPPDAVVTPEQAETVLGHAQATEFDEDALTALDKELRQEEEALAGRQVDPLVSPMLC